MNETLLAMIRANTRLPVDTEGDVYSLAACNDVGCRRLVEMMDEFHLETLDVLTEHVVERSREAVLAEIAKLPKGSWRYEMTLDGYDEPVTLAATTTVSDHGIHVDFTGTSPQSPRGINVPLAYTTAYTVFGLGCVVAARIPNNAGSLAPLTVSAPPGSILNAAKPAPVAIRHVVGQMLPDVVFGCLAPSGELFELETQLAQAVTAFRERRPLVSGEEARKRVIVCVEAEHSLREGREVSLRF